MPDFRPRRRAMAVCRTRHGEDVRFCGNTPLGLEAKEGKTPGVRHGFSGITGCIRPVACSSEIGIDRDDREALQAQSGLPWLSDA
jgi:hypothetical protein